jgi:hypothetical protein
MKALSYPSFLHKLEPSEAQGFRLREFQSRTANDLSFFLSFLHNDDLTVLINYLVFSITVIFVF